MKCTVYELGRLKEYKYVVTFARHRGKWIICRHKGRDTWETSGGHIEPGETPLEAAKRELYEETGALDFDIRPVCDYWACDEPHETENIEWSNGQVFFAVVHTMGELPESEMECIGYFDTFPENLTYPDITGELLPRALNLLPPSNINKDIKIVNMKELGERQRIEAAQILCDELGWPSLKEAMYEVQERWKGTDAVFLAALEGSELIGWGGILAPTYNGNVFELHPLAVKRDWQRKGVGTALVNALAAAAREKGGLTLWLGADDEVTGKETSLRNADLYDDLPRQLREFRPGKHQAGFYFKAGFKITGVMPDANGRGKPDIFLAMKL